MKALLVSILIAIPSLARADQCELVDDKVATEAIAHLHAGVKVVEYCEPCGDKAPGEPHVIDHIAKTTSEGYYAVTLDKREVDLAYEYVQIAPSHYENVARLAGCATSGVSASLTVNDATDTGVLILPSNDVTPAVQEHTTTVIVQPNNVNLWLIVGACVASGGLWALATIMILKRRRQIAMRPRAIHMRADL